MPLRCRDCSRGCWLSCSCSTVACTGRAARISSLHLSSSACRVAKASLAGAMLAAAYEMEATHSCQRHYLLPLLHSVYLYGTVASIACCPCCYC